jgi:hypothetical protein
MRKLDTVEDFKRWCPGLAESTYSTVLRHLVVHVDEIVPTDEYSWKHPDFGFPEYERDVDLILLVDEKYPTHATKWIQPNRRYAKTTTTSVETGSTTAVYTPDNYNEIRLLDALAKTAQSRSEDKPTSITDKTFSLSSASNTFVLKAIVYARIRRVRVKTFEIEEKEMNVIWKELRHLPPAPILMGITGNPDNRWQWATGEHYEIALRLGKGKRFVYNKFEHMGLTGRKFVGKRLAMLHKGFVYVDIDDVYSKEQLVWLLKMHMKSLAMDFHMYAFVNKMYAVSHSIEPLFDMLSPFEKVTVRMIRATEKMYNTTIAVASGKFEHAPKCIQEHFLNNRMLVNKPRYQIAYAIGAAAHIWRMDPFILAKPMIELVEQSDQAHRIGSFVSQLQYADPDKDTLLCTRRKHPSYTSELCCPYAGTKGVSNLEICLAGRKGGTPPKPEFATISMVWTTTFPKRDAVDHDCEPSKKTKLYAQ